MKKLIVVLIAAFSIITACLIYLIKEGISLRLGRVIEPTLISVGEAEMARSLVSRLTPILQHSKYIVFGIDKEDPQTQTLLEKLESEFKKDFKQSPQIVSANSAFLAQCQAPCWIMTVPGESTHLQPSDLLGKLEKLGTNYFTVSILRFDRDIEVPEHCEKEKRISIDCVTPLAVREARRKFKEDSPYFFVRNYNEQDYFLFLEN